MLVTKIIERSINEAIAGQISSHLEYGMFYRFLFHNGQLHGQMQQHSKNGNNIIARAKPITQAPTNTNIFPALSLNLFPKLVQSPPAASAIKDLNLR